MDSFDPPDRSLYSALLADFVGEHLGMLLARRGIAEQSQKTGLSKNDVADRIIAYYQATGLLEQRIA